MRVGEGQDQEVPGKKQMNARADDDWFSVNTEGNEELPREDTPLDDGDI